LHGQHAEQVFILIRKRFPLAFVENLQHADRLSHVVFHGYCKNGAGSITGFSIPRSVESIIRVGIRDPNGFSGLHYGTSDSLSHGETDRLLTPAHHEFAHEFAGGVIDEVERGSVGIEQGRSAVEDQAEQTIGIRGRGESACDITKRCQNPSRTDELRLQVPHSLGLGGIRRSVFARPFCLATHEGDSSMTQVARSTGR